MFGIWCQAGKTGNRELDVRLDMFLDLLEPELLVGKEFQKTTQTSIHGAKSKTHLKAR
jgi:hypothetical protein